MPETINGILKVPIVPSNLGVLTLVYNKEVFEEADIHTSTHLTCVPSCYESKAQDRLRGDHNMLIYTTHTVRV